MGNGRLNQGYIVKCKAENKWKWTVYKKWIQGGLGHWSAATNENIY